MWSVVTESPSQASTRAPSMSRTGSGVSVIPAKKGGFATYVESAAHSYRSPSGIGSARQRASPSNTDSYAVRNSSPSTASAIAARTASADGQMSARKTGAPSSAMPSGSVDRSMSIRPASA